MVNTNKAKTLPPPPDCFGVASMVSRFRLLIQRQLSDSKLFYQIKGRHLLLSLEEAPPDSTEVMTESKTKSA